MLTEIFIEGRRADVNAGLSSLITYAIDDIKDFSSRQTAFSKTIVLPGTANNNAIFGNIFETGISNDFDPLLDNIGFNFNAAKAARCVIFQDNLQTFKGTVRLLEIVKDKSRIEYEVALNGELTSLSVALTGKLLEDLDFSAYDQAYSAANITSSWSATPGSGVYFPLIDYGTYSTLKHDWDFRTFRPALYVKEYIDKIFQDADFRYSSALFETNRFKRLIVPHNQKLITKDRSGDIFFANRDTQQEIVRLPPSGGLSGGGEIFWPSWSGSLFTSPDGVTFTYNGGSSVEASFITQITGFYNFSGSFPNSIHCKIFVRKNGTEYYYDGITLDYQGPGNKPYFKNWSFAMTLDPGDNFHIRYELTGTFILNARVYVTSAFITISTEAVVAVPIDYGEELDMQLCIPKNIRQIDFLVSLVKLFNLYVYESQFDERLIYITPFIDFYETGSGSSVDWTYKLDRNKPIKIKPLSEVNSKIYNFNYKEDNDYFNEVYKKRYNQVYGSHIFDSQLEFVDKTDKLELIFAPTPLVGYDGEDKVYPTIFKKSGTTEETIDSVIRIMQSKHVEGVTTWQIKNVSTVLTSGTTYGYAGHFDDPDNPGNDLNFGVLQELFFVLAAGDLTKTQFNLYWSTYMAEITDKDSKLLTAKFYLTPKDIFDLSFSKFVYLDGSLFRLNKITDYNASMPDTCEVELLKVIQTSYSFPPGSDPGAGIDPYLLWSDGQIMDYDTAEGIFYGD
jgi:hypothetical protein